MVHIKSKIRKQCLFRMSLSQTISVRSSETFPLHHSKTLSRPICLADAKYYSHQLKVNLAFHRRSKSKGEKRRFAWDSSSIYLFVFSAPIPLSLLQLLFASKCTLCARKRGMGWVGGGAVAFECRRSRTVRSLSV